MKMKCVIVLTVLALTTTIAAAGTVGLAWDPVTDPDLAGYKIYYGTATGVYSETLDVGNVTVYTVNVLDCAEYFFALKAYDATGNESVEYSTEVFGWPRPIITTLTPNRVERATTTSVTIDGTNFRSGSTVIIPWDGVSTGTPVVNNCGQIVVPVTVAANAPEGFANVEVRHPDNVYGEVLAALEVSRDRTPPGRVNRPRREGDIR